LSLEICGCSSESPARLGKTSSKPGGGGMTMSSRPGGLQKGIVILRKGIVITGQGVVDMATRTADGLPEER
jgi:hypothetical protein